MVNRGPLSVPRGWSPGSLTRSRLAWTVLVGLAAADILLTLVGLQSCLTEENPVAERALATFGPAGLVGLKGVALGLLVAVVWRMPNRYGRAAMGGFCLTQVVAVGWNAMLVSSRASLCGG